MKYNSGDEVFYVGIFEMTNNRRLKTVSLLPATVLRCLPGGFVCVKEDYNEVKVHEDSIFKNYDEATDRYYSVLKELKEKGIYGGFDYEE